MENAMTVDRHKTRGDRTVDEDLKFCLAALARGNSFAMQGQLESATRDLRAVEDAAGTVKKALAKAEDEEFLDQWNRQLAEVQRGLSELSSKLDIPPERELTYHPGRIEPGDGRA
jgi:predicted negative regulator of RcsB-dependent stress response